MFIPITTKSMEPYTGDIEEGPKRPTHQTVRTEHLINLDNCIMVTKDKKPTQLAFVHKDGLAVIATYETENERTAAFQLIMRITGEQHAA